MGINAEYMGSVGATMVCSRSVQSLVLLFYLVHTTPVRNPDLPMTRSLKLAEASGGICTTCFCAISTYDCHDINEDNLEFCRRKVCPRCSYNSVCLPEWCPPPTSLSK